MSFRRGYKTQGATLCDYNWPAVLGNHDGLHYFQQHGCGGYNSHSNYGGRIFDDVEHDNRYSASRNVRDQGYKGDYARFSNQYSSPSSKRRKLSENAWGNDGGFYWQPVNGGLASSNALNGNMFGSATAVPSTSGTSKRGRSVWDDDDDVEALMSKDEIERLSPSRKDGIDVLHETRLRYSYCAFIQNLGMRLDVPQTTIGTAMVLCHRFFVRRSHACHDRFLIGFPFFEAQAKLVAQLLAGKRRLPSWEEMMQSINEFYQSRDDAGIPRHNTHDLASFEYCDKYVDYIGFPHLEEWKKQLCLSALRNSEVNLDTFRNVYDDFELLEVAHQSPHYTQLGPEAFES